MWNCKINSLAVMGCSMMLHMSRNINPFFIMSYQKKKPLRITRIRNLEILLSYAF